MYGTRLVVFVHSYKFSHLSENYRETSFSKYENAKKAVVSFLTAFL